MKKLAVALIVVLCCTFTTTLADSRTPQSSADRFWGSLGETWDAFLDLAGEAADSAGEWLGGASENVTQYLDENLPSWRDFVSDISRYFDKNVSPELQSAWETLLEGVGDIGSHSKQELESAYKDLQQWLEESGADEAAREALNELAGTAGVDVEE